jgi:osomolarity two-component system sensor histidine kinase SLN1
VLDFQRMDNGRFDSVSHPFSFHSCLRSLLVSLRVSAQARKLDLEISLDPRIDQVVKQAAVDAFGPGWEGRDLCMGDEMRIRQVLTNLTRCVPKIGPSEYQTKPVRYAATRASLRRPVV